LDELQRRKRREEARRRVQRQRRLAVLVLLAGLVAVIVVGAGAFTGGDDGDGGRARAGDDADAPAKPKPPPELPRGGRRIFPRYRIVGFYGAPQDDALGALGIGSPEKMAARLRKQARPYRGRRRILPAFELIAVVASGAPGDDGSYSFRQPAKVIDRYLKAARKEKALLVLDVQPGRANFMREVRRLRPWLEQPDVSLALDPEWRVGPGQIPGKVIGTVSADEVNRVTRYVRGIVREKKLPQKLLLIHQFTDDMIPNKQRLLRPRELAVTINVDGFGDQPNKISKYEEFARGARGFHHGFKLFYEEDTNLMSPKQVLRLRPRPSIVVYE
jgi:hypothetical protein